MTEHVVLWKNQERREWDCELFETQAEAEAYAMEWSVKCPFNTYRVLSTVNTIAATEPYPHLKCTVTVEPGQTFLVTIDS